MVKRNETDRKSGNRRSRPGHRRRRRERIRAWWPAVAAGAAGLLLGAAIAWIHGLQQGVIEKFEQRRFDQPSLVYARPLEMHVQTKMPRDRIGHEFELLGYRKVAAGQELEPGSYFERDDATYVIQTRDLEFAGDSEGSRRIALTLAGGAITRIAINGRPAASARLQPAEIGSLRATRVHDRKFQPLAAFPDLLVTGIQAVEDRRFKHHAGIDWRGLARALWVNLTRQRLVQGGSTISQQLVRNMYLSNERTIIRKFNELLMSMALERRFSKHEILESYLNEVYLGQYSGGPIHGFPRASEFYFGRSLDALEPHHIALLIGMVRGASWYNPRRNPGRARARRDLVLDIFRETGLIADSEARRFAARALDVTPEPVFGKARYPAFMELVRRQLRRNYPMSRLRTGGLRIMTTLDPYLQQRAEQAVMETLPRIEQRYGTGPLQAGVVVIDAATGDVLALVGDRVPDRAGFNRVLDARRQIGSVIKPFIYMQALAPGGGHTLVSTIEDRPITVIADSGRRWQPQNFDHQSHGEVLLLSALVHSYNQATVRLGLEVGVGGIRDLLVRLGLLQKGAPAHPALLLGALEASPLQVAAAYQPLAAAGYRAPLSSVRRVLTADGGALSAYPVRIQRVLPSAPVALIRYAMTRISATGTARSLNRQLRSPAVIAGKTGTSDGQRDAWFVGFDERLLAVVWVGRDDNREAGITGAGAALPLWAALFDAELLQSIDVSLSGDVYWYWIDIRNGLLSSENCPAAALIPFRARTEPQDWSPCN